MIILYGVVFLLPFSGAVHLFDWDEIIFAESAREMIVSGDYLTVTTNYQPFWEKPPLFIWMQTISMKLFGINEFAARFPNVLGGIVTLLSVYLVGRRIHGEKFGMLWAVTFGTAILPFFYFRTGIIDPWFNLFIFHGFAFFIFYLVPERFPRRYLSVGLSAFFLGLAVLTKGPVAVLVFAISFGIYLIYVRGRISVKPMHVITFATILAVTGGFWFLLAIFNGNMQVVSDFITYQAGLFTDDFAGHGGFPGFHFVILLFGVFPASVIMLTGFQKKREDDLLAQSFRTWMYILFFLVLVLFSIVQTKLVHYSSLAYYPMTFIAAWVVYLWLERKIEIRRWQIVFLGAIALLLAIATAVVPAILINPGRITGLPVIERSAYIKGVLMAEAGWGIADFFPAVVLLTGAAMALYRINKRDPKGVFILHFTTLIFIFSSMVLFVPKVERMIQHSAIEFMKSHSEPDEHVITLGFKSFAPLFYGNWMPGEQPWRINDDWLNEAMAEKPVYVVMKADNSSKFFQKYPQLEKLHEKDGYVFAVFRKTVF
jgi:hypothetical protein